MLTKHSKEAIAKKFRKNNLLAFCYICRDKKTHAAAF